jgi:putative endonuclease
MSFFLYILRCSDNTYYTGSTNNLMKRIHEHNFRKSGAKYTKMRRPVSLVYSESYDSLRDVRRREHEIKQWERDRKEKLWLGDHE